MLFIISAPSGTGKTSLVAALLERMTPLMNIERVITYTTKTPRPTEVEGVDYYFVSENAFKDKIAQSFFIEWSTVYDAYYGSPRSILEKMSNGISSILIIDRPGAKRVLDQVPEAISIWIEPPSIEALEARLKFRNADSEQVVKRRIEIAHREMLEQKADPFYRYTCINDVFENALIELEGIFKKHVK